MIFDKVVEGGCSGKRPDVLIDYGLPIIVECDERQHVNYSCENKRICELFQDLGSRPLRVIRFNPDGYLNQEHCRIQGCFKGVSNTTPNAKEWKRRIDVLSRIIFEMLEQDKIDFPKKEIDVVQLFFDGFD